MKLKINDHVLLKAYVTTGKFSNRWIGPYIISKKLSDLNYEIIKLINNIASTLSKDKFVVHVNRIKLVTENPNEVVVSVTTPIIAKLWGTPQMKKKYIPNPSVILNVEAENLNSSNPNQIQF